MCVVRVDSQKSAEDWNGRGNFDDTSMQVFPFQIFHSLFYLTFPLSEFRKRSRFTSSDDCWKSWMEISINKKKKKIRMIFVQNFPSHSFNLPASFPLCVYANVPSLSLLLSFILFPLSFSLFFPYILSAFRFVWLMSYLTALLVQRNRKQERHTASWLISISSS